MHHKTQFLFILGPCSLESYEISSTTAAVVKELANKHEDVRFYFKGSFDKANRTSATGPRGPGQKQGLSILQTIKEQFSLNITTDIHLPDQAKEVASVVDALQIPAYLCRQTDLLEAAAKTGKIVNVKKGQFLSPSDMKHVVSKLRNFGCDEVWQTERGTTFGYQNLVVDMRSFTIMNSFQAQTVFDATHSVQEPGGGDGKTTGDRKFVPRLAKAAIAAGAGGIFLETHPNPDNAISDGPNQIPLSDLPQLVDDCLALWRFNEKLNQPKSI